jgi:hypothetical protein
VICLSNDLFIVLDTRMIWMALNYKKKFSEFFGVGVKKNILLGVGFRSRLFRLHSSLVNSHRNMFTSEIGFPPDLVKLMLQLHLEPLFYKYHVDVNLYAHQHSYERSCPMYQHECVDDGIVQVLIGIAGQSLEMGSYSHPKWSL